MYSDPVDGRRAAPDDTASDVLLPPAWRLAGEDDDHDDHPHIVRGAD
ncbi:hypothetical protein [Streptomyces bauhiniae]